MSVKPENQFRAGVHKYLPRELHHEKMCNPFSSGTADDWYSGNKADLWIEYKFLPRIPQRGVVKPALSQLQLNWLRGRYEEGRAVYVIVGCPSGGVIMSDLEWEGPVEASDFVTRIMSRKDLALWITSESMR